MNTLQQIQSNPKTNVWGSLGSRNRVATSLDIPFNNGKIWAIAGCQVIYNDGKFNESIELDILPESVLLQINAQIL